MWYFLSLIRKKQKSSYNYWQIISNYTHYTIKLLEISRNQIKPSRNILNRQYGTVPLKLLRFSKIINLEMSFAKKVSTLSYLVPNGPLNKIQLDCQWWANPNHALI